MYLFGYYKVITFLHTPANEFHDTLLLPAQTVATIRARAPYRLTPPPPPHTHTHTMLRPSLYIALSTVVFFNTTQHNNSAAECMVTRVIMGVRMHIYVYALCVQRVNSLNASAYMHVCTHNQHYSCMSYILRAKMC